MVVVVAVVAVVAVVVGASFAFVDVVVDSVVDTNGSAFLGKGAGILNTFGLDLGVVNAAVFAVDVVDGVVAVVTDVVVGVVSVEVGWAPRFNEGTT